MPYFRPTGGKVGTLHVSVWKLGYTPCPRLSYDALSVAYAVLSTSATRHRFCTRRVPLLTPGIRALGPVTRHVGQEGFRD